MAEGGRLKATLCGRMYSHKGECVRGRRLQRACKGGLLRSALDAGDRCPWVTCPPPAWTTCISVQAAQAVGYAAGMSSTQEMLDATKVAPGAIDYFVELHIEQGRWGVGGHTVTVQRGAAHVLFLSSPFAGASG